MVREALALRRGPLAVAAVRDWLLAQITPITTPTVGSYGMKHVVERRHPRGAADLPGAPHRRPADKKVIEELVNAFKRVTGKENILFAIAEASLGRPDDPVRQAVYPAVVGGEQTLRELVHEFKTKGPPVHGAPCGPR